jgi:AraC-like DNA-binding protein
MNVIQNEFLQRVADLRQILDPLDRIPGAMFMIKNLNSRYIYMSRALRQTIHLAPGFDVVGKTDFELFPKIIAQHFRQNDLQVFRHGKALINEIHATGFFDHPTQWSYSSKFPLHDRKGKVIGLITINEKYNDVMGRDAELNRLLPAIEHISRHYADRITVGQLAKLCSFSESHFMRVFRQRMKMTPYAFVEQVRLFHAGDAILHSAASISEIAVNCGFYDHSSFVKRFKKSTGTTPMRHRREYQKRLNPERAIALPMSVSAPASGAGRKTRSGPSRPSQHPRL